MQFEISIFPLEVSYQLTVIISSLCCVPTTYGFSRHISYLNYLRCSVKHFLSVFNFPDFSNILNKSLNEQVMALAIWEGYWKQCCPKDKIAIQYLHPPVHFGN